MQTAQHKRSRGDETSQQSSKRSMTITSQDGRDISNSDLPGSSRGDETSQQSSKRSMTITSQDGGDISNSDLNGGFHQRSPYEIKLGKTIRICPKCYGESKVRANLSKKARAKRKEAMQQTGNQDTEFPTKPCNECDASGLIAISPIENNITYEDDSAASSEELLGISVAIVGGGIGEFVVILDDD